ncbi:Crp/Fnr family transcriptional regulator [Porphyromonas pogonae]|uniref:Crp/Fnr family transcriptional regulator n=1 Tax=Porphyromonas pogonae TaxID=867595 RepID=UPI002E795E4E|nr:Crp/Fnr family transcriptional regulator [Porphyromonas pogonae]
MTNHHHNHNKNADEHTAIEAFLKRLDVALSDEEISLITEHFRKKTYNKGEKIFEEDSKITTLYCLNKGKIKMFRKGFAGRTYITRMVKSGEFFGIRPYFAGQKAKTSAEAFEYSEVYSLPTKILEKLISENVEICRFFLKRVAEELGVAEERAVSLTQKHVRGRLAEVLLFLMENYGFENDGATLDIYLSREDLAALSNMTTSNAIRTLSLFASEKIIALDGRKIKIIDPAGLQRISRIG